MYVSCRVQWGLGLRPTFRNGAEGFGSGWKVLGAGDGFNGESLSLG